MRLDCGTIPPPMNPKHRNMRVEELMRAEREFRKKYNRTKNPTLGPELRDLEQAIRDKIWNKGGAQWKKDNMGKLQ